MELHGFDVSNLGCSFAINFSVLGPGFVALNIILLACASFATALLPSVLYTAMFIKGRKLSRVQPATGQKIIVSRNPEILWSQQRSKRVTVTYLLLLINFFFYAALFVIKFALRSIFRQATVSYAFSTVIFLFITDLQMFHLIADLGILLINKDERTVLWKLLHRTFKLLFCGKLSLKNSLAA